MGKKYIVELKKNETLYKAATRESDGTAYVCSAIGTPYTEPDTESIRKEAYDKGYTDAAYNCHERCAFLDDAKKEAYQRGYETAKHECEDCNANAVKIADDNAHEAYQKGLSDAWDAARKVVALSTVDRRKVFGSEYMYSILEKHTASEAIEKIRAYEQAQEEIKVGDEVTAEEETSKFVVTWMNDRCICGVDEKGKCYSYEPREISGRTGRRFPEIAEVLQKMRGTE